jgi:hypothetical protein
MLAIPLISRGYFPADLPPAFTTRSLASFAASFGLTALNLASAKQRWSRPAKFSLARPGGLRRPLSVPNPVHFLRLAEALDASWSTDIVPILARTSLASSRPRISAGARALEPTTSSSRSELEMLSRSGKRVLLRTDIQNFYPSIYTHSIPWALHTKPTAKANLKAATLAGNAIDKAVREGQDGQTMGLPIGPDSSWLIAETILAQIESALISRHPQLAGHRFNDDMTFALATQSEADSVLADLQSILAEYELSLNPRKTVIVNLPAAVQGDGIAELRSWTFRSSNTGHRSDLIAYFDRVATLRSSSSSSHIASYAISRIKSETIPASSWDILQAALLQYLVAEHILCASRCAGAT